MRVLLTTDGSAQAADAIRVACRLLQPAERTLQVLYVPPRPLATKSARGARLDQKRIAEHTTRILSEAKRVARDEGEEAQTYCQSGSPAGVIMREAAGYDIVVLGAKGLNVTSDVGLGPIASRLVEHAEGCVLIGREPPADRQARILVAVDGSDGSEQALRSLTEFFSLDSTEVTLLHVMETLWLPQNEDDDPAESEGNDQQETDECSKELRLEAEQLLREAQATLRPYHTSVGTLTREGVPANEILSEAEKGEYDLIVVGASGATDMKHRVLGSVSSKVAWNAPCSVFIVRHPQPLGGE